MIFSGSYRGRIRNPLAKNIKYVSPVSSRIIECSIVAVSFLAFERAIEVSSDRVAQSFDVSAPLSTAESASQASTTL